MGDLIFICIVAFVVIYGFLTLAFGNRKATAAHGANTDSSNKEKAAASMREFDEEYTKISSDASRLPGHPHLSDSD